jgi:hypothetical protein
MLTFRIDITPEDVQVFAREFFARMYIETLVHGNMDVEVRPEMPRLHALLTVVQCYRLQSHCKRWSNAFSPRSR